jgi:hypothetical protein
MRASPAKIPGTGRSADLLRSRFRLVLQGNLGKNTEDPAVPSLKKPIHPLKSGIHTLVLAFYMCGDYLYGVKIKVHFIIYINI